MADQRLKRTLSLPLIFLYGLGTTIGAGIYALTGEVAAVAGMLAPVAFVLALILASFTALTFAELSSRYPRSAGEAVYIREGFGTARLAAVVGLLVTLAGSVSAATMTNAFVGYLGELMSAPRAITIVAVGATLGLLAAWGIDESVKTASVITLIETAGLLLVVWAASGAFANLPARLPELLPSGSTTAWAGVLTGALLAFYAFLGFEDMVNVAEEIRDVRRVLPLAIVLTLLATTVLYVLVATVSVLAVDPAVLGASEAPLAVVYESGSGRSSAAISLISLLAMVNGSLVQVIMASRIIYGLADGGSLPSSLARVHPRRRTPIPATACVTILVVILALWFPLATLAQTTSVITLTVFTLVNVALVIVKRRAPAPPGTWSVPPWVPMLGASVSASFLLFGVFDLLSS